MMTLILPLLIGGLLGGWALLSIVGGERTRRIRDIEALEAAEKAAAARDAAAASAVPIASSRSPAPKAPKPAPPKPATAPAKPDAKAKAGKPKSGK